MKARKKYNKVLSTAVILSMVMGPTSALADTGSPAFKDLNQAAFWAQGGIMEAKNRELMRGDHNGNFRPKALVTRQEIASMLVNILNLQEPNVQGSSYTDVPPNAWGLKAIEAVKNAGIMRGDGNGKFRPNAPVTREELAVVLVSAVKADTMGKGGSLTVADAGKISAWAKPAVQVAMEKNLLRGDGRNFNPKQNASRQEVAIMAVNLANALKQTTPAPTTPTTPAPVDGTVEASIESVTNNSVTLNGTSYNLSSDVKDLLNEKNSDALKGATIKVETKDRAVTKVTYLKLTASGKAARSGEREFSNNVVLDGGVVNGDVKVEGDYVSLRNLKVKGDLEITREVNNDFYAYNITVTGKTQVNGGDSNTVTFESAELGKIDINKQDVRVELNDRTKTDNITISSNAVLVTGSGVTIPRVMVQSGVSSVEVKASITTLDISDKNTRVTVSSGASINNIYLPSNTKVEDVVRDYSQVKGRISNVNGNSSSTGKSGSKSSSNETDPDKKIVMDEANKYESNVTISSSVEANTDITKDVVKLIAGKAANTEISLHYSVVAENQYVKIEPQKITLIKKNETQNEVTAQIRITFSKNGRLATKDVIVRIESAFSDAKKVAAVVGKIDALPAIEALTLQNKAAVTEAKAAYDMLTAYQKQQVLADKVAKLDSALAKIKELESNGPATAAELKVLTDAITAAKGKVDAAAIGNQPGQYPQTAVDTFKSVITAVDAVAKKTGVTKAEVDKAVADLKAAEKTFDGAKVPAEAPATAAELKVLTDAITAAKGKVDAAAIGDQPGQYPQTAVDTFKSAIATVDAVAKKTGVTKAEVDKAVADLKAAEKTFDGAKVPAEAPATAAELKVLTDAITAAKGKVDAAAIGDQPGQYPQTAVDTFKSVITTVDAVAKKTDVTKAEVDKAVADLKAAEKTFDGTKVPVEAPETKVKLAEGSLGTAGDKTITGLDTGKKYKVTVGTGAVVKYVKADGTLSDVATDAAALTGTSITGLTNGETYKVEIAQ
ncbi:S-layer homology domain-containing protein [Aneurinibacillus migulanus]|uniref:S-layer homology domain-containing protein n=2 Tax=Aneurinibacillus migulanus TaxID=47500 RepID=UPI0006B483B7|nr:S-layer homology domain-containing protein [Aneurinibacillus migulanus]